MNRRTFMKLAALATTLGGVSCATNPATGRKVKRPNIVVILSDDMGYSDISCYGAR